MGLRFKKQGFAFTFLTLFVSFLMFAFASFLLSGNDFNAEEAFTKARVSQLSSEINYFEGSYLPTATSYALFNTIDALIDFSKDPVQYALINNNYSRINDLIYEGMTNGSFNSIPQNKLINNSLEDLLSLYEKEVENSLSINFTYDITQMIVYEKDPFFLTVQILLDFQVEPIDNISSWDRDEIFEVSIPLYNFDDPEFTLNENISIPIRPIGQFASNIEWNLNLLNETIRETYSVVYLEPTHDYTIGTSFLRRLLNDTVGSYNDVLLRYSFDLDETRGPIYDNIQINNAATLFSDTLVLINFDNETLEADDMSAYNNDGSLFGPIREISECVSGGCYSFDGIDDQINISHNDSFNFENQSFSINFWVKPKASSSIQGLFQKVDGNLDLILNWGLNNSVEIFIRNDSTIIDETENQFKLNSWNMVSLVINPGESSYLYVNGKEELELDTSQFTNFTNSGNFEIGAGDLNTFNGSIDEISIFARELSDFKIAELYAKRQAVFIEYEDTLYDKGVRFDGEDDYFFTNSNIVNTASENFSIEIWFKPTKNNKNQTLFEMQLEGGLPNSDILSLEGDFKNNLSFILYDSLGDVVLSSSVDGVQLNNWHQIVLSVSDSFFDLYLDGFLRDRVVLTQEINLGSNITFARKINPSEQHFVGLLDEVIIYNLTLDREDVENHFFNYRSAVKGCCNYVTPINPNALGYNTLAFDDNVSYSSKIFYDYYKRGIENNVTLYDVTNFTSNDINENYFNFKLDLCMMDVYNIFSYNHTPQPANLVVVGDFGSTCSALIENGIY